jgi:sentrin-specific protease 1
MSRLRPNQWLNDEIINFYGAMLLARSDEMKKTCGVNGMKKGRAEPLDVHYFSTFFLDQVERRRIRNGAPGEMD